MSGICDITPQDQQGQIDNILTRLENLEKIVSQILGSDVTASQLSDISQSVGWVYDVTYMGIPGWTQTPYGSLIPPDGFTVSQILADAQAAQLAANATNGITGVGGGAFSFAQVNIFASGGSITNITELTDPNGIVSVSNPTVTLTSSGLYLFSMQDEMTISTTGAEYGGVALADGSFSLPGQSTVCEAYLIVPATGGSKFARLGTSTVTTVPTGSFALTASAIASGGTWSHIATVSILKLS